MRVLHVLDHSLPLQSGYVFRTLGLLGGQRQQGIETLHLTSPRQRQGGGIEAEAAEVDGWRFERTPYQAPLKLPVLKELAEMRATATRIREIASEQEIDLIHAHSPLLNGYPALWAANSLGIPVVYEIRAFWEDAAVDHGSTAQDSLRYRTTRWLETRLCRKADAVATICEGLRQNLIGRGIASEKITSVPNAVDVDRFAAIKAPDPALIQKLGLEGKTVLGFIGSFYGYEGIPLLIKAMPKILAKNPETCLLLVGGGPDEDRIRAEISASGLERSVVLTGRVPHGTVLDYYALIDLFLFPRLSMPLTELVTPLKPLEAMAAGRLVAASDVGGHKELIEDGKTGFLFPANDPEALAKTVLNIMDTKAFWPETITRARTFVETRRWDRVAQAYGPLFERLTQARRRPDAAPRLAATR